MARAYGICPLAIAAFANGCNRESGDNSAARHHRELHSSRFIAQAADCTRFWFLSKRTAPTQPEVRLM